MAIGFLFDQDVSYTFTEQPIAVYTKTIYESGWKIFGGCSSEAEASTDSCSINVIYSYVPGFGYKRVESYSIKPGIGYWMQFADVIDQCELTVQATQEF